MYDDYRGSLKLITTTDVPHVTFAAMFESESILGKEKADRKIAAKAFTSGDMKM